jgi:hypothetical protein
VVWRKPARIAPRKHFRFRPVEKSGNVSEIMAPKVPNLPLCALLGLACAEDVPSGAKLVSTYQPIERLPVDVLLVIDDSPSMHGHQAVLAANLNAFAYLFMDHELMFDVRVAVVTTSVAGPTCTGAFARGGELLTDGCASLPASAFVGPGEFESETLDYSALREATCSLATLDRVISPIDELETDLAMRPWFEPATNSYGGNLAEGLTLPDVLTNVGLRGFGGCEFESPLAAADRALESVQTAGDPGFGFLRTGASLLIVFIGDEDDCSHPESSATIFDPQGERVFWSDPQAAAPTSAVCHNAATLCNGRGCQTIDRDLAGNPTEDPAAAVLDPATAFAAELASLRAERDVAVVLIGGVASDGDLAWPEGDPLDPDDLAWREEFGWSPGCIDPGGGSGQPPGRLHAVAAADGVQPLATSICTADWTQVFAPGGTGPSILHPWCAPAEIAKQLDCELSVRTPIATLALSSCMRDENGWLIDPETSNYQIPPGEDRCWVALDDLDGATSDVNDDISPECVDQGSAVEWIIAVRPGALPLLRGSVYESSCAAA